MKRKAFTLVEMLAVIAILALGTFALLPIFTRARESDCGVRCPSLLKQIALGVLQYTQDYDEKLPPTKNAKGGWAEIIHPYIKSYQIFQCPASKSGDAKTSDYFFNARLSGVSMEKIPSPNLTISFGDGTPDQPLDAHLSQLPATWLHDSNATAHRHLEGANYAFVDGHVKYYKPNKITLDKPDKNNPTFLIGSF